MRHPKRLFDSLYRWVNSRSGGALDVIQDFFGHLEEMGAAQAAASLAYYAMFSLFPMLLAIIAVGAFFLQGEAVMERTIAVVRQYVPVSRDLVASSIEMALARQGSIGLIGAVGLIWSGIGALSVLMDQIGRAWGEAGHRGAVMNRLLALIAFGGLMVVVLLPFLVTPVLDLLAELAIGRGEGSAFYDTFLWRWLSAGIPPLSTFLALSGVYFWVPATKVRWPEALAGSLFTTLAWELAKFGFTWYVSSSLVDYPLVYGSLSAVMALMFWIYISGWLLILGAHLSAAVARLRDDRFNER